MALLFPRKPAIFNQGQLRVANIYSRPALAPFYRGLRGFGQARRTSTNLFADTLRSFATGPFSVNSAAYMQMIRERYGYTDEDTQNALGTIGSIVGAGIGGLYGLGYVRSPISRGFLKSANFFKPSNWQTMQFQKSWTGKFNPIGVSRVEAMRSTGLISYTSTQKDLIKTFNDASLKFGAATKKFQEVSESAVTLQETLQTTTEEYNKVKHLNNLNPIKKAAKTAKKNAELAIKKVTKNLDSLGKEAVTLQNKSVSAAQVARDAGVRIQDSTVNAGKKISVSGSFKPSLGLALNTAAAGISVAGLIGDIRSGADGIDIGLSAAIAIGDVVGLAGNILTYTGVLSKVGGILLAAGKGISFAANAIRIGKALGTTAGRSLTPSGLKAQQLLAENIAANITARPITTLTALTVQIATPWIIGELSRGYVKGKANVVQGLSYLLSQNVIGNQVRAGLTMMASRALIPYAAKIDQFINPLAPESSDFVSAISLFGDIQDNIYGSTRVKSIVLGLVKNDPNAQRDAMARAWGFSDERAYVINAADIVEETPLLKNLPAFPKSVLGVVGEMILDPRNLDEMLISNVNAERGEKVYQFAKKEIERIEVSKRLNDPTYSTVSNLDKIIGEGTILKNIDSTETITILKGAIDAYTTKGAKGLAEFIETQFTDVIKGSGTIKTILNLPTQQKIFLEFIESVVEGRYVSPITVNNNDAKALMETIKLRKNQIEYYKTNKKLPDNITKAELKKHADFLNYVEQRYNTEDLDTVAFKIIEDFKLKVDSKVVKNFYDKSDAFANYMDFTEDFNSNLIMFLNPIGKMIQKGETRLFRWFSEYSRDRLTTSENRQRTLIKDQRNILTALRTGEYTVEKIEEAIKTLGDDESKLRELLDPNKIGLSENDEYLRDLILSDMNNSPETKAIIQAYKERGINEKEVAASLLKAVQDIDAQKSEFNYQELGIKTKNGKQFILNESNYNTYFQRLIALRKEQTEGTINKEDLIELKILNKALVNYEAFILNNEIIQTSIKHYQNASIIMNVASEKADAYLINLIQSLYAFKHYVNSYIPVERVKQIEDKIKYEDVKIKEYVTLKSELQTKIKKLGTDLKELESSPAFENDPIKLDLELANPKSPYSLLKAEIANVEGRINDADVKIVEFTKKKDNAEQELKKVQKLIKDKKTSPTEFVASFNLQKHEEIMNKLDDIQKINFLNGVQVVLDYTNEKGEKIKTVLNESIKSEFIRLAPNIKVIDTVGIIIKETFAMQIADVMRTILGTSVFEAIKDHNHKLFDITSKDWNNAKPIDNYKRIYSYILSSDLSNADKEKILNDKELLLRIYTTLETRNKSADNEYNFLSINQLSPSILYRYVLQEQFKLYKDGADPEQSENSVVKAFLYAAKELEKADQAFALLTKDAGTDDTNKYTSIDVKDVFEKVFKDTPIYKYVKAYMYDYVSKEPGNLTFFKRTDMRDVLPDSIDKLDIEKAKGSLNIATSIINNTVESELSEAMYAAVDKESVPYLNNQAKAKVNLESIKVQETIDENEQASRIIESTPSNAEFNRLLHKEDETNVLSTIEDARTDSTKLTNKDALTKIKDDDVFGPLQIRSQLEVDPMSFTFIETKDKNYKFNKLVESVLDGNFLDIDFFEVDLQMRNFIFENENEGKIINFAKFLKQTNVSDTAYKAKVREAAYRIALILKTKRYNNLLKVVGKSKEGKVESLINKKDNVKAITKKLTEYYLKNGNLTIRISVEDEIKSKKSYSSRLKQSIIKEIKRYVKTSNVGVDVSTDGRAIQYFKDLLGPNSRPNDNTQVIIYRILKAANTNVSMLLRNNTESIGMLTTLKNIINEVRSFERDIKESIAPSTARLNPSLLKKSLSKSQEVKAIMKDLVVADKGKNKKKYNHIMFKLMDVLNEYITEDYVNKKSLPDIKGFIDFKVNKDGDIVYIYQTESMRLNKVKPVEYNTFDLLFIHSVSRTDMENIINVTLKNKAMQMGVKQLSNVSDLYGKAFSEYENITNELGQFITHNTLTIDKELFLKQGGSEEEYRIVTDPNVNNLKNTLTILATVYSRSGKVDLDYRKILNGTYKTYFDIVKKKLLEFKNKLASGKDITDSNIEFYATDKDGNKKTLFTVDMLNEERSVRTEDTMYLLVMLKLAQLKKEDYEGYIIKSAKKDRSPYINTDGVKELLRSVFFKDVKDNKGKAQAARLEIYEDLKKQAEEDLKRYESKKHVEDAQKYKFVVNRLKNKIQIYTRILKEYTDINKAMGVNPQTDEGWNMLFNDLLKDDNLAERYFNNNIDTDSDNYVLVLDENNKYGVANRNDIKNKTEQVGIPSLNNLFINYVFGKNNETVRKSAQNILQAEQTFTDFFNTTWGVALGKKAQAQYNNVLRIVTDDGTAVIVVPDKDWTFKLQNSYSKLFKAMLNEKDPGFISDVFILSETKYKELQQLTEDYTSGKLKDYPSIDVYKVDSKEVKIYPPVINVQSTKNRTIKSIVQGWVKDLNTSEDIINTTKVLDDFNKYNKIIEKGLVPVSKTFNLGVNLFNTESFKKLKQWARINTMFYLFTETLDDDKVDLEYIGSTFFKGKFFSSDYDMDNFDKDFTSEIIAELKNKNLYTKVKNAILAVQKEFGNDVNIKHVKYSNVFAQEGYDNLLRLKNIITNAVKYVERTNQKAYKKILPLLKKHLEESLSLETEVDYIKQQIRLHDTFDGNLKNNLEAVLKNPFTIKKEALEIFKENAKKIYEDTSITQLQIQQYYLNQLNEKMKAARQNHYFMRQKLKYKSLDFVKFSGLKSLYKDLRDGKVSLKDFRTKLNSYIQIPKELISNMQEVAEKIFAEGKQGRHTSKEDLAESLIFGYAVRAYLISVTQSTTRSVGAGIGAIYNDFMMVNYIKGLQRVIDLVKQTPEKERTEEQINTLKLFESKLKHVTKSKLDYKYNEEQLLFKGLDSDSFYAFTSYENDIPAVYKKLQQGQFPFKEDIKIDEYFEQYLFEEYGFKTDDTDLIVKATNAVGQAIAKTSNYIFNIDKNNSVYVPEVEVIPLNELSSKEDIEKIKEEMREDGFKDNEIELVFSIGTPQKKRGPRVIKIKLTEQEIKDALIIFETKTSAKQADVYINKVFQLKKNKAALAIIKNTIKSKRPTYTEIFKINSINVLEKSTSFLDYFRDVVRNYSGTTDIKKIYSVFKNFGLNEEVINKLLGGDYENISHFINSYVKENQIEDFNETKFAQANMLMLFINYHKNEFIKNKAKVIGISSEKNINELDSEDLKKIIEFEYMREKQNVTRLQTININDLFGDGVRSTNGVSFELNKGFVTMRKARERVNLYNDRLSNIILDTTNVKTREEYSMDERGIYFEQNKMLDIAAEVQRDTYDVVFVKDESGMFGMRKRELALMISENVQDLMAENIARSVESVGSNSPLYNSFRINFTEVLKLIKSDFTPEEFIKMQNIASAISILKSHPEMANFFKDVFNQLVMKTRATKEEAVFNQSLEEAMNRIVEMSKINNKIITLDESNIKAIIGLIYTQRFDPNTTTEGFTQKVEEYTTAAIQNTVNHKQYKHKTIRNKIESIVTDTTLTEKEVRDRLAALQGTTFKELSKEQQETINSALALRKFFESTPSFFTTNRWYDTLDAAMIDKGLETAGFTTVSMKEEIALEDDLQKTKNSYDKAELSFKSSSRKYRDEKTQKGYFKIKDQKVTKDIYVYDNSIGEDDNDIVARAEKTANFLDLELQDSLKNLNEETKEWKKSQREFLKNLFKVYPGLQKYFEEKQKDELNKDVEKQNNELVKLSRSTKGTIIEAYKKVQTLKNAIKLLTTTREYTIVTGYNIKNEEDVKVIFELFKDQFKELNILSEQDLLKLYTEAKDKTFKTLKEFRDEVEKLEKRKGYSDYAKKFEIIENKLSKAEKKIADFEFDVYENSETSIEFINDLIDDYNKDLKTKTKTVFKNVKELQQFDGISEKEKESILKHHTNIYNQRIDYLRKAYTKLREFNLALGKAPSKELTSVINDKNIKAETLTKSIKEELEVLILHNENLENLKIQDGVKAVEIPEVELNAEDRTNIYIDLISNVIISQKEIAQGNKPLNDEEKKYIVNYINNTLKETSTIEQYNYLKNLIESKTFINPTKNSFGQTLFKFEVEGLDENTNSYIKALVNNINYLIQNTYNKKVQSLIDTHKEQIKKTIHNMEDLLLQNDILNTAKKVRADENNESAKKVFNNMFKNEDGKPIIDVDESTLKYMLIKASGLKFSRKGIGLKNRVDTLKKRIIAVNEYKEQIKKLPQRLESLNKFKELIKAKEEKLLSVKEKRKDAQIEELQVSGDSLKNVDLFKKYYEKELSGATSNDAVINKALEILISKLNKNTQWTVDKLKEFITKRGEFELHNSTVDTLITVLNYMHQKDVLKNKNPNTKAVTDKFVVIDFETYKRENTILPYQISLIVIDENGEMNVHEVYINNGLFYNAFKEDGVTYTTEMETFFEQQKKIWTKQWEDAGYKYSSEMINKLSKDKLDTLIARVRTTKNNNEFIKTFIDIAGPGSNFKIVAHNGYKFDFGILENFIQNSAKNLIANEFYRDLNDQYKVKKIYERINNEELNSSETTEKRIQELTKAYSKLMQRLKDPETSLREEEIKTIQDQMESINNALLNEMYKVTFRNSSMRTNYIVSDDVKKQILDIKKGPTKRVIDALMRASVTDDYTKLFEIENELVLEFSKSFNEEVSANMYEIIRKFVKDFMNDSKETYKRYIQGGVGNEIKYGATKKYTTINTEVQEKIFKDAGVTPYKEDIHIDQGVRLRSLEISIDNRTRLLTLLNQNKNKKQIIKTLRQEQEPLIQTLKAEKEEIKKLKEQSEAIDQNKLLDKIISVSKKLYSQTNTYTASLNVAINNAKDVSSSDIAGNSFTALNNARTVNHKKIIEKLQQLESFARALKAGKIDNTDLIEKLVSSEVLAVLRDPTLKENVLAKINDELKTLKNLTSLDKITEENSKILLNKILTDIKESFLVELKDAAKKFKESLDVLKTVKEFNLENLEITNDFKFIYKGKPISLSDLTNLINGLNLLPNAKTLVEANKINIVSLFRSITDIQEGLNFQKVTLEDIFKLESEHLQLFNIEVNSYFDALNNSKEFIELISKSGLKKDLSDELIALTYLNLLNDIEKQNLTNDYLEEKTVIELITGHKPTDNMNDEQYNAIASRRLNLEEIAKESKVIKKLGIKIMYDDPNKTKNILALRYQPNTVLGKRIETDTTTYIYTVVDELYNEPTQFIVNSAANTIELKIRYAYGLNALRDSSYGSTKGYQVESKNITINLDESKRKDWEYSLADLEKFINTFYHSKNNKDTKYTIIPGVQSNQLDFEEGYDSSKRAIEKAILFIKENAGSFRSTSEKRIELLDNVYDRSLTHEKFALDEKHVSVVNITNIINKAFIKKISTFNEQELTNIDLKTIYSGIYNKLTSRYKALEPGSILNQLNPEYSFDYNYDNIDIKFLEKWGIDLNLNSEGSAGTVFKYKTRYELNFPFALQTNAIRTMLSGKHILAHYTTIKFLNDVYADIPDQNAPGKKLLETFVNPEKNYGLDPVIKNRMIRKNKNNKFTQIFMPNVMSKGMYKTYKEDTELHQLGITEYVAFGNDPRIPLDMMGIDADYARSTRWGDGNKTWLGLHSGFKGAVVLIEGLYDMYGANFVADSRSVSNRGTAGVYSEMLFNYIRAYLIEEKNNNDDFVVPENLRKVFELKEIKQFIDDNFKNNITDDGVLKINDVESYQALEDFSDILQNNLKQIGNILGIDINKYTKDNVYQLLVTRKFKDNEGKFYTRIYTSDKHVNNNKLTYEDINKKDFDPNKNFKRVKVNQDLSQGEYALGLIYVYADHENSAQAMQTKTQTDSVGNFIFNIVDANQNPIKGTSISPTVAAPILSIIGKENFDKVFPINNESTTLLTEARLKFDRYINQSLGITNPNEVNNENFEEYIEKLKVLYANKKLHKYVYQSARVYLQKLSNLNDELGSKEGLNKDLEAYVSKVGSEIYRKLYQGKNSALYASQFRRYDGIRQQFALDVGLDIGEIVLSKEGWDAIAAKNKDNKNLIKTELMTNQNKVNEYIEDLINIKSLEGRKEFLNSRGLFLDGDKNKQLHLAIKNNNYIKALETLQKNNTEFYQTYTYLLSARSPVQDYGAVPVFKAIGFSSSAAAKVNLYAYKMMGADNDGDTFGMMLLRLNQVEGDDAPLKKLLATNLSYYSLDEEVSKDGTEILSYIDEQNKESYGTKDGFRADVDFKNGVATHVVKAAELLSYKFNRNQTGKNTLLKEVRPLKAMLDIEFYRITDKEIYADLIKIGKENKYRFDPTNIADLKMYVNAYIRINNEGEDFNDVIQEKKDYENVEKLMEYYNSSAEIKETINALYSVEQALNKKEVKFGLNNISIKDKELEEIFIKTFDTNEQEIIKDSKHKQHQKYYKYLVLRLLLSKAQINTTARVRSSKTGVNYGGNKRKDQFISSFLALYPNINKSKQGYFWKVIGASNSVGEVTFNSLIKSLFSLNTDEEAFTFVKNNLSTFQNVEALKTFLYATTKNEAIKDPEKYNIEVYIQDIDLVLKDIVNLVDSYVLGEKELRLLKNLSTKETITVGEFKEFIKNSSKKDDIAFETYLKIFNELDQDEKLDSTFINELLIRYFNGPKILKLFREGKANIDDLLKGLFDQYIIERVALNNMSKLIQKTISVSKHAGQDSNANNRYINYKKEVDNVALAKSLRKVMFGTNNTDFMYGFAINLDRDINNKVGEEGKYKVISTYEMNKQYFIDNPNKKASLQETYTSKGDAVNDMNSYVVERAKLVLLGNMYMDAQHVNKLFKNIIELNKLLENRNDLTINKKELDKVITFFEYNDIPFYLLNRFVEDSLSIAKAVKDRYIGDGKVTIEKTNIVNNVANIAAFAYELAEENFKEMFSDKYSKETVIINYFTNLNRLEEGMYITDSEGNPQRLDAEFDIEEQELENVFNESQIQVAISNYGNNDAEITLKDSQEIKAETIRTVSNKVKNKINLFYTSNVKNYRNVLESLKAEVEILVKNDESIVKQIQENKNKLFKLNLKTSAQRTIEDKKVRSVLRNEGTRKRLKEITILNNQVKENEERIEQINIKIKEIEKRVNELEKLINDLENAKMYQKNTQDLRETITEEIAKDKKLIETIKRDTMARAMLEHIGGGVTLLRSDDDANGVGGSGIGDGTIRKPKLLTEKDLQAFKLRSTLTMESKISHMFNRIDTTNEESIRLSIKQLYRFIKEEQKDFRFVMMLPPDQDEGRYKKITSYIRKYDEEIDGKLYGSRKIAKGFLPETFDLTNIVDNNRYNKLRFEDLNELQNYKGKVVMQGKVYDNISPSLVIEQHKNLTPTLKEVVVTSEEQLLEIYKTAKQYNSVIGFVDINAWMETMNSVYNPYQFSTQFDKFVFNLQIMSKNISKFSASFLARNLYDTVNQLFTNALIIPKGVNANTYVNSTINSIELYSTYIKYSDEHTISIINMGLHYEDILKESKKPVVNKEVIKNKIKLMEDSLTSYIRLGNTLDNERIKYRIKEAEQLLVKLKTIDISKIEKQSIILKQSVTFISNITFGEFIELYDNRKINGKWVAGLRVDAKDVDGKIITRFAPLEKRIKDYKLKKPLLKQLSAFMNTEALNDYLKKDRFEMLPEFFENYRGHNSKDLSTLTYEQIKKRLAKQKGGFLRFLNPFYIYEKVNTVIENGARITNFFYNLMIYNKTFDESVRDSLSHWFNYGMRSPLEFRLLADMPFVSFPLRSIENWIDRINSPKYWRFMADFLDGWYGQYRDEETKEFDEFTKFQMRNGWIPLGKNFGIRIGNGAFDLMNTIYNTREQLEQRASPLLRGIKAIAEGRGAFEAIKQMSIVGILGRVVNTATGTSDMFAKTQFREAISRQPVAREFFETRPSSIGTTYRGFVYDISNYGRFIPRRYRYGRNGRYAKYENIYKDYFNKFGQFRRNAASPYRLVKNIQWRQYVRYRQSQAIIGRR